MHALRLSPLAANAPRTRVALIVLHPSSEAIRQELNARYGQRVVARVAQHLVLQEIIATQVTDQIARGHALDMLAKLAAACFVAEGVSIETHKQLVALLADFRANEMTETLISPGDNNATT